MTDKLLDAKPILQRFQLDGRVALVTGGGQGIGRAFAYALGEAGAAVAVVDKDAAAAESVTAELSAKGIDALAVVADVTQTDQIQKMIDVVMHRWGCLTIGVNNAGVAAWIEAESLLEADWDRMMDLNLKAVFRCAQAEAKIMLAAGYGKIINTASMAGHIVIRPQKQVTYDTSKAGVIHLTRVLGAEWASRGVRVNSISPGFTRTKLLDDLLELPEGKEKLPHWLGNTPMNRLGEVTDLQGALVYLASEASDFITGADLVIDGGYCLW